MPGLDLGFDRFGQFGVIQEFGVGLENGGFGAELFLGHLSVQRGELFLGLLEGFSQAELGFALQFFALEVENRADGNARRRANPLNDAGGGQSGFQRGFHRLGRGDRLRGRFDGQVAVAKTRANGLGQFGQGGILIRPINLQGDGTTADHAQR